MTDAIGSAAATLQPISLKSRWRTTEFWLAIASLIVGGLMGSGILGDGSAPARLGGVFVEVLGVAGYAVARSLAKVATGSQPGWRTSEFWLAVVVAVLAFLQAEVIPPGSQWAQLVAMAVAILPTVAYKVGRGMVKGSPGERMVELRTFDDDKTPTEPRVAGIERVVVLILGLGVLGALLSVSGCNAQIREAFDRHLVADQDSARVVKAATAKLRRDDCDAACREVALKAIDGQANAVAP